MSGESWYGTDSKAWAVVGSILAVAMVALGLLYMFSVPADGAPQPGCTAGDLSNALGTVSGQTGGWLLSHPAANDVITGVGDNGNKDAVRDYFAAHQSEWAELQAIAQPLRGLRAQCGGDSAGKASQIGDLYNAMSS